jgi:hypothetical protein
MNDILEAHFDLPGGQGSPPEAMAFSYFRNGRIICMLDFLFYDTRFDFGYPFSFYHAAGSCMAWTQLGGDPFSFLDPAVISFACEFDFTIPSLILGIGCICLLGITVFVLIS